MLEKILSILLILVIALSAFVVFIALEPINSENKIIATNVEKKNIVLENRSIWLGFLNNPESYQVCFKINAKFLCSLIDKKLYNDVNIGEEIRVHYRSRSVTNRPTIIKIEKLH